jgi:hypothetical protein
MSDSSDSGLGCGALGMVVACILSWAKWQSVLWVIIHGMFGWFYVLYYCIQWVW